MICIHCKKQFAAARADAQYCSAVCRVTAIRNKDVTDNSVTDKLEENVTDNVTEKPMWIPGAPENPATSGKLENTCHSCGYVAKNPICICYSCFRDTKDAEGKIIPGKTHQSLGLDLQKCRDKTPYWKPKKTLKNGTVGTGK